MAIWWVFITITCSVCTAPRYFLLEVITCDQKFRKTWTTLLVLNYNDLIQGTNLIDLFWLPHSNPVPISWLFFVQVSAQTTHLQEPDNINGKLSLRKPTWAWEFEFSNHPQCLVRPRPLLLGSDTARFTHTFSSLHSRIKWFMPKLEKELFFFPIIGSSKSECPLLKLYQFMLWATQWGNKLQRQCSSLVLH